MQTGSEKQMVPPQEQGKAIDAVSSVDMQEEKMAKVFYLEVKRRLQDVSQWHEIAGGLSARFQLVDANGEEVNRPPQNGDFMRIDIPGPGTGSGNGYDWVRVEEVQDEVLPMFERYGFRVRPARHPDKPGEDISHFFSDESTSSFLIIREGNIIKAAVYDRNTKPNTAATNLVEKVRDMITGNASVLIFSKLQWKSLTEGLVDTDD